MAHSLFLIFSVFLVISGPPTVKSIFSNSTVEPETEISGKKAGIFDFFPRFSRYPTTPVKPTTASTGMTQKLKKDDQQTLPTTDLVISTAPVVLSPATPSYATYSTEDIPTSTNATWWQQIKYPCSCDEGTCGCCTGQILQNFNFNVQQRGCVNVTYYNEDFEFHLKMIFNNRVFYQRKVSGKNPRPICIPLPRFTSIRFCVKFSNIYMIGRNLHMCIDVEGLLADYEIFGFSFDCIRLGSNGFAVIRPEDGGGLGPPPDEEVYVPKPKPTKPPKPQRPSDPNKPKPPRPNDPNKPKPSAGTKPQSAANKPKPPKPPKPSQGTTDEDYDAIVASEGDNIDSAKSVVYV